MGDCSALARRICLEDIIEGIKAVKDGRALKVVVKISEEPNG
ncbi:MAG: hypothetical protein ACE5K3_02225 [bacterium]